VSRSKTSQQAPFYHPKLSAQCIRCHAVGGIGSAVGPDLAGVANRHQVDYLAESLVSPNQKIAPGYGITSINTKSGSLVAGTVLEESKQSLQIKTPDGKLIKLNRNEIQSQTPTMSMMPPMRGILTDREIRDVVAYLSQLK
jgi:quinoprotein glucose dehydrogenase